MRRFVAENLLEKWGSLPFEAHRNSDQRSLWITPPERARHARAELDRDLRRKFWYAPEAEPVVQSTIQVCGVSGGQL
jgi:hypothetical protein